jgi:hypothetical protein
MVMGNVSGKEPCVITFRAKGTRYSFNDFIIKNMFTGGLFNSLILLMSIKASSFPEQTLLFFIRL